MASTLRASILDGLRLAVRAVKTGTPNPDFMRGIAFAIVAESIKLPPGDPVRVGFEKAAAALLAAGPSAEAQLAALRAVHASLTAKS